MRVIIATMVATLAPALSAFAQDMMLRPITNIPTLSEWGLLTMVGALGIIGAIALRKRLASKAG